MRPASHGYAGCVAKDPDILVDLTTARTAFEAEMIAESLRAQGIAAEAFTTVGSMLQWDIAATQPMRVQVRRRDVERAREVLARTREDARGIDWSKAPAEVLLERAEGGVEKCLGCGYDVSTLPDAEVCPECGTSLVLESDAEGTAPAPPKDRMRRWPARGVFALSIAAVVLATVSGLFALDSMTGDRSWRQVAGAGYVIIGLLAAAMLVLIGRIAASRRRRNREGAGSASPRGAAPDRGARAVRSAGRP